MHRFTLVLVARYFEYTEYGVFTAKRQFQEEGAAPAASCLAGVPYCKRSCNNRGRALRDLGFGLRARARAWFSGLC